MDWQDMFPDKAQQTRGAMDKLEHEATRRLLIKCGLPTDTAENFSGLLQNTSLCYRLVAHKFRLEQLINLYADMRHRPKKTALLAAFEDAGGEGGSDAGVALIFNWIGGGGLHALTMHSTTPFTLGAAGSFWRVGGWLYLLEPFDSFCERIGPATDW